jgi:acetyl esterase
MQAILERLAVEDAGLSDPTRLPPAQGRAQAEAGNARWNVDLPGMAETHAVALSGPAGDIACRILTPPGDVRGTILFVHGGGWAFCSMATHERCARVLAIAARATVVMCDYRLAPEHPFPAGLDDCRAVWQALAARQGPFADLSGPLALSGDSAGANLALALMLEDGPQPDCGLLFYGVYGADFETPSYIDCADGPGLTRDKMRRYWDWYAPQAQRADPRAAPLTATEAALAALSPLYLNAAEIDPLRSDTERLFQRLSALGRRDTFRLHGGVVHGFLQMTHALAEARLALADAGAAFRSFTARPHHIATKVFSREERP